MSRFEKKIANFSFFLLLIVFLLFLGQKNTRGISLPRWPKQSEKIEIFLPPFDRPQADSSGEIKICPLALEGAQRIIWHNHYLYAAGGQKFFILDPKYLSETGVQEANMAAVGSCLIPAALCLAVRGQYAYLGSADGKLSLVDISNPAAPGLINLPMESGGTLFSSSIQGIALLGADLVVVSEKLGGISLLDVSNLRSPKVISRWREEEQEEGEIHYGDLSVWENQGAALAALLWESAAPLTPMSAGFWLIDLTAVYRPVGLAKIRAASAAAPLRVALLGSHLFLAGERGQELEIYDLSLPSAISRVGSYPVAGVSRMLAAADTLCLVQGREGVLCLDISQPDRPTPLWQKDSGGYCLDLAAGEGGEFYLLNGEAAWQKQDWQLIETGGGWEEEAAFFSAIWPKQDLLSAAVSRAAAENPSGGWAAFRSQGWMIPFFRKPPQQDGSLPIISSILPQPGRLESLTGCIMTLIGRRLSAQSTGSWIHFSESQGSFEDIVGWKKEANCWVRDGWECWAPTAARRDEDVVFDSQVAILGHQSYRNNIHYTATDWKYAKECPGKGEFYNLTWWEAKDADQYYYRYYVRYSGPSFQWTDNSWKQLYVHNLFNLNPCMWDHPPIERGPARYDIQGQSRLFVHLPGPIALERWYCLELWVKKNGPGIDLKFWLDGEECPIYDEYDQAPQQFPWSKCYQEKSKKLVFGPLELGTTNCQNWRYEQLPIKQSIWFDGFAMSSTRIYPACIVEIGNMADYAKAKRIRQELLHISDTEVRFRANTAGLGHGPYYLWVTNNRQERSRAYLLRVKK